MKRDQKTNAVQIVPLGRMAILTVNYSLTPRIGAIVFKQQIFKCLIPDSSKVTDDQAAEQCLEDARQFIATKRLEGYTVAASDTGGNNY